jgi:uncharacterized protein
MFYRFFVLACVFFVCIAADARADAPIPELTSPVVDATDTLTTDQQRELAQQSLDLQKKKGSQLQILMISSTYSEDIAEYSQRVFDQWKIGRTGIDDGVLIVIAKDDRRVRIHTGYGLESAIPDIVAKRIIDDCLTPLFKEGKFFEGIKAASTALVVRIRDGEIAGDAFFADLEYRRASESFFEDLYTWVLSLSLLGSILIVLLALASFMNNTDGAGENGGDSWPASSGSGSDSSSSGGSSSGGGSWSGGGGRSGGGGASGSW